MVKKYYNMQGRKIPAEIVKAYISKYNHSPKGIATRKAYLEKNKTKYRTYNREYLAMRRKLAKKQGLCPHCFKNPVKDFYLCEPCNKRYIVYLARRDAKGAEKEGGYGKHGRRK
jgi:hypothetical protein